MDQWQQQIVQAQETIALVSDDFYRDKYRPDETWYWYWVPAMMWYDAFANRDKVKNILDVGCGYGTLSLFASKLYDAKMMSIDVVQTIPEEIVNRFNIQFKKMNIEIEDFNFREPMMYDRIIFTEILEHLSYNPVPTLQKLGKLLTKDGFMYLTTPDAVSWGRITDYYNHIGEMPDPQPTVLKADFGHIYQYTEGELLRVIDEAGFEVVEEHMSRPPYWGQHFNYKLKKK